MTQPTINGLSEQDVGRLFGAVLSELKPLGFTDARAAIAAAGITGIGKTKQYWAPLLEATDSAFRDLSPNAKLAALTVLASRVLQHQSHIEEFSQQPQATLPLLDLLSQHGFQFIDGTFVPIGILDQREARHLPPSSAAELAKAAKRLADGDESGSITASCGAVDGLMQLVYASHHLGDPGSTGFEAKIGTAISRLQIFEDLKSELISTGIPASEADQIVKDIQKATNHAAKALQTLRRRMGDVHGSKPALRRMAYDAMKWSSAICGLFESRV